MKKISLEIDDQKIEVEEGITILEAAKCAGIDIPHLCYREDLVSIGSCRICVVEVEGISNLVASSLWSIFIKINRLLIFSN